MRISGIYLAILLPGPNLYFGRSVCCRYGLSGWTFGESGVHKLADRHRSKEAVSFSADGLRSVQLCARFLKLETQMGSLSRTGPRRHRHRLRPAAADQHDGDTGHGRQQCQRQKRKREAARGIPDHP